MVGKRKVESLRANIAKMARAAETNNPEDYSKACSEVPNLLDNRDRLVAEIDQPAVLLQTDNNCNETGQNP